MANTAQYHLTATWRGPRSVCTCGHLGDGSDSEHSPSFPGLADGHGPCRAKECECQHFTWQSWCERFARALDELKKG